MKLTFAALLVIASVLQVTASSLYDGSSKAPVDAAANAEATRDAAWVRTYDLPRRRAASKMVTTASCTHSFTKLTSAETPDSPSALSSIKATISSKLLQNLPCPTVWDAIAAELKPDFANCSQDAANAIRFAFHDAAGYSSKTKPYGAASGGADGSLLLNSTEIARTENTPMQGFRRYLLSIYNNYKAQGIGAADLVQFAGSFAVASCPGGPIIHTVIGRTDDSTTSPIGLIPQAFGNGASHAALVHLFADKGFDQRELAALMGAHSVPRAFVQSANGVPANAPQDSTPEILDNKYSSETQATMAPGGVYRFDSDINLADSSTASGQSFTEFAKSQDAWAKAFAAAMYNMSNLGISQISIDGFADCTASIRIAASG